jgi:hypothetical protein
VQLSNEELARLEQMFTAGRVRSDPPALSATDRMLDDMIRAVRTRTEDRTSRVRSTGNVQASGYRSSSRSPAYIANVKTIPLHSNAPNDSELDWNAPCTLDELIRIRQTLLRAEERNALGNQCPP